MRRIGWLPFLLVLACGSPKGGDADDVDILPRNISSARFGMRHISNPIVPDNILIILAEAELSCDVMEAPPPDQPLLGIEIHEPRIGDCPVAEHDYVEPEGCLAWTDIVWVSADGKLPRVLGSRPGEGRVTLQRIDGEVVEGEFELVFPKGLASALCDLTVVHGAGEPQYETDCTCTGTDGKTWTCTKEGPHSCCDDGLDTEILRGSFTAENCRELCGCTTEDTYCPCGIACAAPSPDCTAACESAAEFCNDCLPGAECAGLEARCMESCETSLMEPFAAATLGCFEGAASCEEFDDCVEQTCG